MEEKFAYITKIFKFNSFYLILASFFFSIMTVSVKMIDNAVPIYELVFFRSIFSLFITNLIIKKRKINPWGKNKPLLILRGLLGTIALLCIFFSIRNMPLSLSTVIQYTYPIFISFFAVFFLKEKLTKNIIISLGLGLVGIFLLINPYKFSSSQTTIENIYIFTAFMGAICTSLAYIAVKKLSEKEDIFIIIKYFPLISTIILFPIVCLNWITPNINDYIWILGIGIFTQLGQTFLTLGLKNLPATQASTINYMQVLFGSVWGIYFFNEIITLKFIVGSIFVLIGTLLSSSKFLKKI